MSISFTYLGIHIGGNHRKLNFWRDVIDKLKKKKLTRWKGKHLVLVGRVILIESVLFVLTLFYLSIIKLS